MIIIFIFLFKHDDVLRENYSIKVKKNVFFPVKMKHVSRLISIKKNNC